MYQSSSPLKFTKPGKGGFITPQQTASAGPTKSISIHKNSSFGTYRATPRFSTRGDLTDIGFLQYLEGLESPYSSITSILAPSHIGRGMKINPPFVATKVGPVAGTMTGGATIGGMYHFTMDILPEFDVVNKIKTKPKIDFNTDVFANNKLDIRQDLSLNNDMLRGFKTDTTSATVLDTSQDSLQISPLKSVFEPFVDKPFVLPSNAFHFYDPLPVDTTQPVKQPPKRDFFGFPIDKTMGGGGRGGGGGSFFGKQKRFRKGDLDTIFGIEV